MTSFRDYIQHWANLIDESRDHGSRLDSQDGHDISESGGKEPIQKGNSHVRHIMDTLLNTTLIRDGVKRAKEYPNPIDISQFQKDDVAFSVIDVNKESINHDILIQKLKENQITEIKIEVKSSASSSMFQKNVRFEFAKDGSITGVNLCKQKRTDFPNATEFAEWSSIYSGLSQNTMDELKRYWRKLIRSYNKYLYEMKAKRTKGMDSPQKGQWTKQQRKVLVQGRQFIQEAFQHAIKDAGMSMCSAFEFPISKILDHYHDVAYMCIGDSIYRLSKDDPLKLIDTDTNNKFPMITDYYYGSTAMFGLSKDKGRYVMTLRVYGLKRFQDNHLSNARMSE